MGSPATRGGCEDRETAARWLLAQFELAIARRQTCVRRTDIDRGVNDEDLLEERVGLTRMSLRGASSIRGQVTTDRYSFEP